MSLSPNAIARPIQSLWIGPALSVVEALTLRSFLAHGHDVHLYVYDMPSGVPAGVTLKPAAEILEFDPSFVVKRGFGAGSFAPFADLFRITLLLRNGGWWVDLDVVCLKNFNALPLRIAAGSWEVPEGVMANTNVLSLEAGDPLGERVLALWKSARGQDLYHGVGVDIFKRAVAELQMDGIIAPFWIFNPISWRQVRYLVNDPEPFWTVPSIKRRLGIWEPLTMPDERTYAVHLWNEGWRAAGLDKNARYQPGCLFERLRAEYGHNSPSPSN